MNVEIYLADGRVNDIFMFMEICAAQQYAFV